MTLYEMKLGIQELERKIAKAQKIWREKSKEVRSFSQLKNALIKKLLANITEE